LIDGGADVNLGGGIFGSPVHLAIVRLQISIIQSLIDKGADLNKQDSDGNTPLHLVMNIFSKNPERCCHILELLAMNGANLDQKNNDQWAAIHTAVRKGQEKGVNAIIKLNKKMQLINQNGFNLNASGGIQLWSSLHLAAHAS
jgi:ankyrin repeat protein